MALVRRVVTVAAVVVLALALFASGWLVGRLGIGAVVTPASLNDAERQFMERMRDVSLVGSFTVAGREDRTPHVDRYDISSDQVGLRSCLISRLAGWKSPLSLVLGRRCQAT